MEYFVDLLATFDLEAFIKVIIIDLLLSADNAIIIGVAVKGLPAHLRGRAIFFGIAAATLLRIIFALLTHQLLQIVGLTLAGGLLLLWVAWKMWRETQKEKPSEEGKSGTTIWEAIRLIIVADVVLSLDNVLAVSGAAHDSPIVLIFGLGLSVLLMAVAANLLARILNRYYWLVYIGIAVIVYVAIEMIWRGYDRVAPYLSG